MSKSLATPPASSPLKISFEPLRPSEFVAWVENEYVNWKITYKMKGHGKDRHRIDYYSVPAAFDIETSSWSDGEDGDKHACLVCWQLGINGVGCIGRTWDELTTTLSEIASILGLREDKKHLPIYVHFLGHECQWIRKHIVISKMFAAKERTPYYMLDSQGFEWRDSLILAGVGLAKVGGMLTRYKDVAKTDGWNYDLIRSTETPLTEEERQYALNDVLVVMAYIQEKMEDEGGDITKIPMTRTGYVRRDIRDAIKSNKEVYKKVQNLKISPSEYVQLKATFQGGYTHAGHLHVAKTLENVKSYDFTSSYPAVMVMEKFPMGPAPMGAPKNKAEMEALMQEFCCMWEMRLTNVRPRKDVPEIEHYFSQSKCVIKGGVVDNGRVVKADEITCFVTEQDYYTLRQLYVWDRMEIANWRTYYKEYLPTPMVDRIMYYYEGKTTLKNVAGKETEYNLCKERVNSIYGMSVTDIVKDTVEYEDDEWSVTRADVKKQISKYNSDRERCLYYPWGVWCTAYARRNLMRGIIACGENYIYADTDSVKFFKNQEFEDYVEKYNEEVAKKMELAMVHHGFALDRWKPKTVKGVEKPLGYWDFDGDYTRFKTLGAKRYLVEEDGKIKATVAGSNKKLTAEYIVSLGGDPFERFDNHLVIPKERSGKLGHWYLDEGCSGHYVDYLGNPFAYDEKSCLALRPIQFEMTISDEYLRYLGLTDEAMVLG